MAREAAILTALLARLAAHNVTSGILDGWQFVQIPVKSVEGKKDYPILRAFPPDRVQDKAHSQLTIVDGGTVVVRLQVSTKKDDGLVAHALACCKVKDACELNGTTIDLLLGSTLAKPMEFVTNGEGINENSIDSHILITFVPVSCISGGRRS